MTFRTPPVFLRAAASLLIGALLIAPSVHAVERASGTDPTGPQARASLGPVSAPSSGVAYEWIVEDRVVGVVLRSKAIELDDGTVVALDGPLAHTVEPGSRVRIAGTRNADRIDVTGIEFERVSTVKSVQAWSGRGRLLMVHADHFAESRSTTRFELETDSGAVVALAMPIEAGVLEPGMVVEVEGHASADGAPIVATKVVVHAIAPQRHHGAGAKAAIVERVLVVHVKYRDSYGRVPGDPFPTSYARDSLFGSGSSVAGFVNEASYGQLAITGDVTPWLVPTARAPYGCNHTQLGTDARAAATAAGYDLAAYTHQVYVFTGMSCSWSGLSYVGAPHQVWIQGRQSTLVFAHEFGHSLGLLHAGSVDCGAKAIGGACSVAEYGDPFGAMGTARMMHYNAMQKSKLGWIAAGGVRTQTSGTLTHRLAPLELGGGGQYAVRVPAMSGRTYWIEYRQPVGYDSMLAPYPNQGVQIRVATPFEYNCSGCTALSNDTQILDLTPQSAVSDFDSAALLVGRRYRDPQGGVVVEVVAATAAYADVTVTVEPAPVPDTDSSGTTDLLWWNDATGELAVWRMNGTVPLASRTLVREPSLTLLAVGDLDGDGRTDLVVSQGVGGPISGWTMNGVAIAGVTNITSTTGWTVVGTGDVDLDGRDDVVLYHSASGTTSIWMSGSTAPPVVLQQDPAWRVAAVGDFDGDHRADLLWRHEPTGTFFVWLMNGPTAKATSSPGADPNLVLTHVADLNDDGRVDLVFRHAVTGQAISWLMSGVGRIATATLSTDPGWKVVGVGDFDADGQADFAVRQESTGATAIWLAKAGVVTQKSTLFTDKTQLVTHVGDFNGDGKVDLLSRSTSTGKTTIRIMNGGAVASSSSLEQSSAWRVINPPPVLGSTSQENGSANSSTTTAPATTTTGVASSQNPSTVGASVTFTATVTGNAPTGNVAFKDGANTISGCAGVALAGSGNARTAQCATSALTQGTHSITAVYAGDAGNQTSTSGALSQVVNAAVPVATTTGLASSQNPSTVGASVTFTATVTGNAPTGNVAFKDGANTISGCAGVALAGSGNARTAQCATSALTQGTHSITAVYAGDAGNQTSTSSALSQVVNAVAASTNVALAANGGVASASSTYTGVGVNFAASAANNGDVLGTGWGSGGGWNDNTGNAWPDWLQVNFSGQKTINKVVVYTLQDNYSAPSAPTDSMTFSLYGVTGFQVQTWNGSSWVTQGTVTGNNLVKRTVTFTAVTTDRVRVNVTSALASYSRIVEVEAWTANP